MHAFVRNQTKNYTHICAHTHTHWIQSIELGLKALRSGPGELSLRAHSIMTITTQAPQLELINGLLLCRYMQGQEQSADSKCLMNERGASKRKVGAKRGRDWEMDKVRKWRRESNMQTREWCGGRKQKDNHGDIGRKSAKDGSLKWIKAGKVHFALQITSCS